MRRSRRSKTPGGAFRNRPGSGSGAGRCSSCRGGGKKRLRCAPRARRCRPASASRTASILRFAHMIFALPKPQREHALRATLEAGDALVLQICAFAAEADCADLAYEMIFKALDDNRPLAGPSLWRTRHEPRLPAVDAVLVRRRRAAARPALCRRCARASASPTIGARRKTGRIAWTRSKASTTSAPPAKRRRRIRFDRRARRSAAAKP